MSAKQSGKVIPPLKTNGAGFNEVLRKISQADPKQVRQMEEKSKKGK